MLWPKKNSYKEFANKKKFLRLENSPPPPYNFSNGLSLTNIRGSTKVIVLGHIRRNGLLVRKCFNFPSSA